MRKYKLVGLTGTTGAGKGKVKEFFVNNGYVCVDADLLAREIMDNQVVLSCLSVAFGNDVVENGELNRKLLAQRAFESKEKTALLNSITHPFISELFVEKIKGLVLENKDNIIFDAPQLFESKLDVFCDVIVSVIADEDLRIKRIVQRDNISEEQAKSRVSVQFKDEFFVKNSDYVIENNKDIETLKTNTQNIIDKIREANCGTT